MDQYTLNAIFVVLISYLMGSFPTAYLIAKSKRVDIFAVGSGNMGGTNVMRAMGFKWGIAVAVVDVLKGIVAIYISRQIMSDSKIAATTISAITVIIGHNWSLFASILTGTIQGGKGAATALGTLLMIAPLQIVVVCMLIGGVIIALTRYVSLAVLVAFFLSFLWLTVLILQQRLDPLFIIYAWTVAALMLVRFRGNIQRLLAGTERRFGERV